MSVMTPEDVQQHLSNNAAMREIYEEVGELHPDTIITEKHNTLDIVFGPRPWSELFNPTPRLRPHISREVIENYDVFYPLRGASRVVGTAWLAGMLIGGMQGFYEGLSKRSTYSWRVASQSFKSFSRTKGPLRANQYGMIAFMFCFWETIIRGCALENRRRLRIGEPGMIFGRFGTNKEEEKATWQTDGRVYAPIAAALGALTVRGIKGGTGARPAVMATNMTLAAMIAYVYAHLWTKDDYFDPEKVFLEL